MKTLNEFTDEQIKAAFSPFSFGELKPFDIANSLIGVSRALIDVDGFEDEQNALLELSQAMLNLVEQEEI